MKIKDGFLLRRIAGQYVALPSGDDLDLNMMITLNETAAFLWEKLLCDTDSQALAAALLKEYDVTEETAVASVSAFLEKLRSNGFLE